MRWWVALAWALGAQLLVDSAPGAPGHSHGFGSRASALAGAVGAGDGDAAAVFYNPALLALAPHSQLLFGYRASTSALQVDQRDSGIPGFTTVDGAALGRGLLLGIPVGFGLGLALTNGHLSRVKTVPEDEPYWVLRETLPELLDLSAAVALQPTSWLALGIGSGFLATTRGGFEVRGTALAADGAGSEYDSRLTHSVDAQLVSVRYLLLGAELLVPPALGVEWRLGLSLRDEAKLEQALRGTLQGNVDAGFFEVPVRYVFDSHSLVAFQPRQLVLAAAARSGATRVGFDLGWEQWSRYPSPLPRSGTNVEAEVPAGLPLALPESQPLPEASLAGFDDRFTLRASLEHLLSLSAQSTLALRAGYAFLPTPAPRKLDAGVLLDADEHVLALGAGLALEPAARYLPRSLELDLHGQWSRLPNRRHEWGKYWVMAKGNTYAAGLSLSLSF